MSINETMAIKIPLMDAVLLVQLRMDGVALEEQLPQKTLVWINVEMVKWLSHWQHTVTMETQIMEMVAPLHALQN